ncbi:MAG: hypothetical protein PVS3B3_23340 [Ktedonobacteraceae bacterium]
MFQPPVGTAGKLKIVRRLHILFVDTDVQACKKIQQTLHDVFVVTCVMSLTEAKQKLGAAQPPDILITEVLLNQENGLDLCSYIRTGEESLQKLPIMLLTSLMTLRDKVRGFEAGADDYVVKPFDSRHLIARINLLARIKRLEPRISS